MLFCKDCLSSLLALDGKAHKLPVSSSRVEYMSSVLSVTCFAQMKYACIRLMPHPTGGLRLIDSRLCNLLTHQPLILSSVDELTLQA
jgi:hypothetical protein